MNSLKEKNRAELIELENTVVLLKEEIEAYRSNTKDSSEKRLQLTRMQVQVGKHNRRLKELRVFI